MTFLGNINLIYIDRPDLLGSPEKRQLAIPRGISYENFRARLEGALEVKQPPERILVALSRLYTPYRAGTTKGQGRQRDNQDAWVFKLAVPEMESRCREDTEPKDVFDEMMWYLEGGRNINLLLQRPWHLDSACIASDDTDDMDIEDDQVLPQLPGNRDPNDIGSILAPYERSSEREEAPLESSDAEFETSSSGSRRQSSSSSIAESDSTMLTELSDYGCLNSYGNSPSKEKM
ncbi:hypothetical protein PspLS_07190 [Pyricularia sp. CBS 133598]|nr:hypothetical protein PspLS_07190 [Pyricularia sp. CBS 133598]